MKNNVYWERMLDLLAGNNGFRMKYISQIKNFTVKKKKEGEEEGQGRTTHIIFVFVSLGYQKPLRSFFFDVMDVSS